MVKMFDLPPTFGVHAHLSPQILPIMLPLNGSSSSKRYQGTRPLIENGAVKTPQETTELTDDGRLTEICHNLLLSGQKKNQ